MIQEIIQAFILIFVAEMGDKTQILAMAFATRFPVKKVLLGIGIGSFLNHGLAVLLGSYLATLIPINTIQMVAGIAFIGFALWTLKAEEDEEEDEPKIKFGPVATVSLAFFLGELGDKTQLAAITLATNATYPYMILIGTVTGMIATGSLGIIVGKKMGDKVPELAIKLFAATIFMIFGIQKLWQTVPTKYLQPIYLMLFTLVVGAIVFFMVRTLLLQRKRGIQSAFLATAKILHDYYEHINDDLANICMGCEYCGTCQGSECAIGHAKEVVQKAKENQDLDAMKESYVDKPFSKEDVFDGLLDTLWLIENVNETDRLHYAHVIRKQMEFILFSKRLENYSGIKAYIEFVEKEHYDYAIRIEEKFGENK